MRILFCHENFPDRFGFMASYLAANPEHEVLFASRFQRRGLTLPGVRRVILKKGEPQCASEEQDYAQLWCRTALSGKSSYALLQRLNAAFQPHLVLTSASRGLTLFVRQAFPQAFQVFYVGSGGRDRTEGGKLALAVQGMQVLQSQLCFAFSEAQRKLFPAPLRPVIQVTTPWVDTDRMNPAAAEAFRCDGFAHDPGTELISWDMQHLAADREQSVQQLLAGLLAARPLCRMAICCGGNPEARRLGTRLLQTPQAGRLHVTDFLRPEAYRDMVCASRLHICADTAESPLPGWREAMSCGAALMLPASAAQTSTFLRPGENMLPLPASGPEAQLSAVLRALERPESLDAVGRAARGAVVAAYSPQTLVPPHAALVLESVRRAERAARESRPRGKRGIAAPSQD